MRTETPTSDTLSHARPAVEYPPSVTLNTRDLRVIVAYNLGVAGTDK